MDSTTSSGAVAVGMDGWLEVVPAKRILFYEQKSKFVLSLLLSLLLLLVVAG